MLKNKTLARIVIVLAIPVAVIIYVILGVWRGLRSAYDDTKDALKCPEDTWLF